MIKKLTIAIPTFNRYTDLRITLNFFLSELSKLSKEEASLINFHIQDNCSQDNTINYLEKSNICEKFEKYNSSLSFCSNSRNLGFDKNVKLCFQNAQSEYVWLVSDDDQIFNNSIKHVLKICKNNIDLGHMLFEQLPFVGLSKFSRKKTYFEQKLSKKSLYSIIYLPKVTSFIYKLIEVNKVLDNLDLNSGFIHIEIALRISLKKYSNCLYDFFYIGKPRALNSSNDFSSIVFNNLFFLTKEILKEENRIDLIDSFESQFEIKEVNPLLITLRLLILKNFRLRPIKSNVIADCFYRLKYSKFKYNIFDKIKNFAYIVVYCFSFLFDIILKIKIIILNLFVKYFVNKIDFIRLFLLKKRKINTFPKFLYFKSVINTNNILIIDPFSSKDYLTEFRDKKFAHSKIFISNKNKIIELNKIDGLNSGHEILTLSKNKIIQDRNLEQIFCDFDNEDDLQIDERIAKDANIKFIVDECKISKIDLLFLKNCTSHMQFINSIKEVLYFTKFIVIDFNLYNEKDFKDLFFIANLLKINNHAVYINSKIGLIPVFNIDLNSINSEIQLISILNI